MYKFLISTFFLLLTVSSIAAQEESKKSQDNAINHLPFEYMNIQYAGNIGLVSIGAGNSFFDDHYDLEFYLGVTPKYVSEITIVTLAVKNNYIPYTIDFKGYSLRPYIGLGLLFSPHHRYNPNWQDEIPDNYYYQNSWHATGHLGLNFNKKVKKGKYSTSWLASNGVTSVGLYVEVTTIDTYFVSYLSNKDVIALKNIFSTSFGFKLGF
jgi:hypothetical protein